MKYCVDYVWIDGNNNIRSKVKVVEAVTDSIDNMYKIELNSTYICIPDWNFDGSSTNQSTCQDSEVVLKPKRIFQCPFRKPNGYIVICECWTNNNKPHITNNRYDASIVFDTHKYLIPWFGLEQEYYICDDENVYPIKTNNNMYNNQYCSPYTNNICRDIVEKHLKYCIYAGINISGINAEVENAQWEYQIGPSEGILASDELWISRYILIKIAEKHNKIINFHPKLVYNQSGSGCHVNFSTINMRNKDGVDKIYKCMKILEKNHSVDITHYGKDNDKRLGGKCETSKYENFTYGVGDRNASIRIPNNVIKDGCGYFEDRRPAANIDPYLVTKIIFNNAVISHQENEV